MKKLFFLLACLIVAVIVYCNYIQREESPKIKISFSGYPMDFEEATKELVDNQMERFMKENPGIEIKGDKWVYEIDSFLPRAASGQLPTMYKVWFTEIDKIINAGYGADLTKVMKKHGYDRQLSPEILELISKNGVIYAVPSTCYSLMLRMHAGIMRKAGLADEKGVPVAPKTYDELAQMCVQIKERTGKYGFVMPTVDNDGGWNFMNIAWSYGTDFMEKRNGRWQATFDSPEFIAALDFFKDLRWKYDVVPHETEVDNEMVHRMFLDGEVAMAISDGRLSPLSDDPDAYSNNALVQLPAGPEGRYVLLGGSVWFINSEATEEEIEACIKWMQFTGITPEITENVISDWENEARMSSEMGGVVGVPKIEIWNTDERMKRKGEIIAPYVTVNPEYMRSLTDFEGITLRMEETVNCQELYKTIDEILKEILRNPNADTAKLAREANAEFQLKNLEYKN